MRGGGVRSTLFTFRPRDNGDIRCIIPPLDHAVALCVIGAGAVRRRVVGVVGRRVGVRSTLFTFRARAEPGSHSCSWGRRRRAGVTGCADECGGIDCIITSLDHALRRGPEYEARNGESRRFHLPCGAGQSRASWGRPLRCRAGRRLGGDMEGAVAGGVPGRLLSTRRREGFGPGKVAPRRGLEPPSLLQGDSQKTLSCSPAPLPRGRFVRRPLKRGRRPGSVV